MRRQVTSGARQLRADDGAAFDQQPVAGAETHRIAVAVGARRRGHEVEQVAAQRNPGCGHDNFSGTASCLATSRTRSRSQRSGGAAWVRSCHSW